MPWPGWPNGTAATGQPAWHHLWPQLIGKTTFTVTPTSWLPGWIGTSPRLAWDIAARGTEIGEGAVTVSAMLTAAPNERPAALAYCSALVLASTNALSRAWDTSTPVSSRSRLIPLTRTASPPAPTASPIASPVWTRSRSLALTLSDTT